MLCQESIPPGVASKTVEVRHSDDTVVVVQVSPDATLANICQAEAALTRDPHSGKWCDASTQTPLDSSDLIAGRSIRILLDSEFVDVKPEPWVPLDFDCPDTAMDVASDDNAQVPAEPSEAFVASEVGPVCAPTVSSPTVCPAVDSVCSSVPAGSAVYPAAQIAPDVLLGLKSLSGAQLAAIAPPLVKDVASCQHMRQAVVSGVSRLELLHRERSAMGDDELNLHIQACLAIANTDQVRYLDPILATTWMKLGTVEDVAAWLTQFPHVQCIVTVVHLDQHWLPIVWNKGLTECRVSLWEHTDVEVDSLCHLHGIISAAWGCSMFVLACNRRSFGRDYCGTAAVAFLAHKLIDAELPPSDAKLLELHLSLRNSFATAVHHMDNVPKPWFWGLGVPDVVSLTASLLQVHGVPVSQIQARAKLVVQSLGRLEVQKAVTGSAPWRSLKALANQQKPVLQLVLPDEIHQKTIDKQPLRHGKGKPLPKGAPARPAEIDPSKLMLEPGSFCFGDDEALAQSSFPPSGPLPEELPWCLTVKHSPFCSQGKF